jgi:formate dehydrogenase subunit gamma
MCHAALGSTGGFGMARYLAQARFIIGACVVVLALAFALPASAQRNPDGSVNPTASAVKEQDLLNALQRGGSVNGRVSIPDQKSGNLIHPAGRDWRQFHEVTLRWIGAIAILGMLVLLVAFYLLRGQVKLESGYSGRRIVRFNGFERFIHWMTATCFIILALSGLNITFGKALLMPLIGEGAFAGWSQWVKYAHNYLSFPFTIGVVVILLIWVSASIPNKVDVAWLKRGGGIVGHDHPPAYRFNGGQKMIYWIVVVGGGLVAASGYTLMFPFYLTGIEGQQLAQIVHAVIAVLFVAAMLAHIYIGTIGMEGAFEAMGEGTVDVNWAREHHALWLEQEMARTGPNNSQRQPMATPAE